MKRIFITAVCSFILQIVNSQSISPIETGEFCPNIEYTFTVTITKQYSSIIGLGGSLITQAPQAPVGTTFTFKGKFTDANQKQTFRVTHPDGTATPFEFKRVKSLFYQSTCTPIQPNQSTITAPRCQITNHTISFNNIQWSTAFESPSLCFGSITTYEYLLPNGWSIGGASSNGNNWIAGGNNVTVTSDLSTGDGSTILVRPTNSCGTGLSNGYTPVQIGISRPAPALSITRTQDYICSGCTDFTINGVPSGASIQWGLSNTVDASINGCSTCSTVNICRNTSANTVVVLTATVTHCNFTYTRTQNITLGTGTNDINFTQKDVTCEVGPYFFGAVAAVPSVTNYAWYSKDESNPSNPFVLKQSENSNTADFPLGYSYGDNYYTIRVIATVACGSIQSIDADGYIFAPDCSGGGLRIMTSPNPTSSNMTVQVVDEKGKPTTDQNKKFYELQLSNNSGTVLRQQKFNSGTNQATINLSGLRADLYHLRVWDGKKWTTKSVIKK